MSATGLRCFDSSLHTTNKWLKEIASRLGCPNNRKRAYQALRAVIHALRDRLDIDGVAAFGAQLPLVIRGLYYEGWHPAGMPIRVRHQLEFLTHIAANMPDSGNVDCKAMTQHVFQVIAKHLSPGEINHIVHVMPHELRDLWEVPTRTRTIRKPKVVRSRLLSIK